MSSEREGDEGQEAETLRETVKAYSRWPVISVRLMPAYLPLHVSFSLLRLLFSLLLTRSGNCILREVDVSHPAAKSMIELSRAQEEEVGAFVENYNAMITTRGFPHLSK